MRQFLSFVFVLATLMLSAVATFAQPCCRITAIRPGGLVTARVNTSGQQFQFAVKDPALLRTLKVGQGIYANIPKGQVSLDGRAICCSIVATPPAAPPQSVLPSLPQSAPPSPPQSAPPSLPQSAPPSKPLAPPAVSPSVPPAIAAGPAQGAGWSLKHVDGVFSGQHITADIYQLVGAAGIQGSSLPPAYKQALVRQAQLAGPGSVFMVTKASVDKWALARQPGTPQSLSVDSCNETTVTQSFGTQSFDRAIDLPLSFNNTSLGAGLSASGTVDIKFPFKGTLSAELQAFHSPCLFYYRPKGIRSVGDLQLGAQITVDIQKINFQKDIPIPASPITYPLLKGVVLIGGEIPVEAGIDLFVQGGIDINAQAEVDIRYSASGSGGGPFDFSCDGKGCSGSVGFHPAFTSSSSVSLHGQGVRASVKPYVFGGLQFEIEGGSIVLAQIGPRPYVVGDLWAYAGKGCGGTIALGTLADVNALTADLDAGMDVRYHLTAPGVEKTQVISGTSYLTHLGFWDLLGNSTGLTPVISANTGVTGAAEAVSGASSPYRIKMRPCYPYTDQIQYAVSFGANTTAGARTLSVSPAALQGSPGAPPVSGPPQSNVTVNHVWPSPGDYPVDVSALRDQHGRVFHNNPSQLMVTVR